MSAVTSATTAYSFETCRSSSQFTMDCMTCQALNFRQLCDGCARSKADNVVNKLIETGNAISVAHMPFCQQIAAAAVTSGNVFCPKELVLQHKYAILFDTAQTAISSHDLSAQHLIYAQTHCSKYGFWYENKSKTFLRTTHYRFHDADSILEQLKSDPAKGLSIDECVKEYPTAYLDLHSLLKAKILVERRHYVWLNPLDSANG